MEESSFCFVTLGGSITTGYAAPVPAQGGWAALVARDLAGRVPGRFSFRNRGVSGTDSVSAALRVVDHAAGANLVVLEFAVNDQWLDPTVRRQAFEGCLRQILGLESRPQVLCLFLCEQGDPLRGLAAEQRVVADHYGVPWIDFGTWYQDRVDRGLAHWEDGWDPGDPIHPNATGHALVAQAVLGALEPVLAGSGPPRLPREPLYSSDWQFVRAWDHRNADVVRADGWEAGSDVHGEWLAHGGAPSGWHTDRDDAVLELRVTGKVVGVLYSESDGYRNLEASVDGGPPVVLEARVPSRKGYLGWAFRTLARDLTDGTHVVRLRFGTPGKGTGDPAHVVAVVAAGVADSGRSFLSGPGPSVAMVPPRDLPLTWTGRFDPAALPGARFSWQLGRLTGRFTGPRLGLRFNEVSERNYFRITVDGRGRLLELLAGSPTEVWVADDLGPGEHSFEIVKRSEGFFGSATLAGLGLAPGGTWLPAPQPLPRRLEFYGDSITAGACNEDGATDQYDTLATHDPDLSYGAITARRLGAEVVNLAVSGTGLTCSWNPVLLPQVWDRLAPSPDAPVARVDRVPDVVVINVGQNDYGFPHSQGGTLDPTYGDRLVDLVRRVRQRYPGSWIVGALGGMTGWKECEPLRRQWARAWERVRADDPRVRSFFFRAATGAHPRVDVHALLAEELTAFLAREVWPHLETPLY